MAVGAFCIKCGRIVFAPLDKVGQTTACPGCGDSLRVVASLSRDEPVNLTCPKCGSVLRLIRELHGRKIRCSTCQVMLEVSAAPWRLSLVQGVPSPPGPARGAPVQPAPSSRVVPPASLPPVVPPAGNHDPMSPLSRLPWVTPPDLLDKALFYRQQGSYRSFECRCGELANSLLAPEVFARVVRRAELQVYPDLVAVEATEADPGRLATLLCHMPHTVQVAAKGTLAALSGLILLPTGVLGTAGLPIGVGLVGAIAVAVVLAAIFFPLVAIPALLGFLLLWIAFQLVLDSIRSRVLARTIGRILLDPQGADAVRETYRYSPVVPRYWRPGEVIEVVRVDLHGWFCRRAMILLVQDEPMPDHPARLGLQVQLGRWRSTRRRLYALAIGQGEEAANQAATAVAGVLGLLVGRMRFGLGGLRRE